MLLQERTITANNLGQIEGTSAGVAWGLVALTLGGDKADSSRAPTQGSAIARTFLVCNAGAPSAGTAVDLVDTILRAKEATPVNAPAGEAEFLDWLNRP